MIDDSMNSIQNDTEVLAKGAGTALFGKIIGRGLQLAVQVLLARLWLVPHNGVFYLVPVFAASALVFGVINGLVAAKFLNDDNH